jgi:5S rRNA maturation endonuclease (ribonuclease M5)
MTTRRERQREALEGIKMALEEDVKLVLVEGTRDVKALHFLGVSTPIDVLSHVGIIEQDIVVGIASRTQSVLVLTDFDEKGRQLAIRLSALLAGEGVHVQQERRRKIMRLMGVLGIKTIEALDDWVEKSST